MIVSIDAAYFALPGFEGQAATHPRLLRRHPLRAHWIRIQNLAVRTRLFGRSEHRVSPVRPEGCAW